MNDKSSYKLVVLSVIVVIFFCFLGVHYYQNEWRVKKIINITQNCETIDDVIDILGPPYEIYEKFPPKLGANLLDEQDDECSVAIYAFVVKKTPPLFLVIKVSKENKGIHEIGVAKS